MLLSGGVDSTVCAALMNRALGVDRVLAIHIDNGFMRKGESDQVRDSLEKLGLNVRGDIQTWIGGVVLYYLPPKITIDTKYLPCKLQHPDQLYLPLPPLLQRAPVVSRWQSVRLMFKRSWVQLLSSAGLFLFSFTQ